MIGCQFSIKINKSPKQTTFRISDFRQQSQFSSNPPNQQKKKKRESLLSTPLLAKMSDGALTIVDGTQLRAADLTEVAAEDDADLMTGAKVLELAESRATSALFGLSLPQTLKSSALRSINLNDEDDVVSFRQTHLSSDQASLKLNHYLTAIADQLKGTHL